MQFGGIGSGIYGPNGGLYGWLESYGSLTLTDSSPVQSFVEPFTLDEVKSFLKLPARSPTDPDEDDLITGLISAARVQAEYMQGRDLVQKQWDLSLDFWLDYFIKLRAPLVSVDLFTTTDNTGLVTTLARNVDYIVDTKKSPGVVTPPYNSMWPVFTPWPSSAILIRYTSGFANGSVFWQADGRTIKVGMKRLINDWFTGRLPFERNFDPTRELPFGVTTMLSQGTLKHVG
jgi:uncharacterized phiE125 gp8 family phage protein